MNCRFTSLGWIVTTAFFCFADYLNLGEDTQNCRNVGCCIYDGATSEELTRNGELGTLLQWTGYFTCFYMHKYQFALLETDLLDAKTHYCICSTFLHCVSSNGFSNCLPEKRHSHIGCICLTFVPYVFSKVSSKRLDDKMQSHTHWLHLFDFSPLCVFKCVLKSAAWEEA